MNLSVTARMFALSPCEASPKQPSRSGVPLDPCQRIQVWKRTERISALLDQSWIKEPSGSAHPALNSTDRAAASAGNMLAAFSHGHQ
jgi:hypothetical protein